MCRVAETFVDVRIQRRHAQGSLRITRVLKVYCCLMYPGTMVLEYADTVFAIIDIDIDTE